MRYRGQKIAGPRAEILVFPRETGDIAFKIQAVLDFDEFEAICPTPKPPMSITPGAKKPVPDFEHPDFKKALQKYSEQRTNWMVLKSLQATVDLEWETVNMTDPETWTNYESELKEASFNQVEIQTLLNRVFTVNSIDEARMEEAKRRFLTGQEQGSVSP